MSTVYSIRVPTVLTLAQWRQDARSVFYVFVLKRYCDSAMVEQVQAFQVQQVLCRASEVICLCTLNFLAYLFRLIG